MVNTEKREGTAGAQLAVFTMRSAKFRGSIEEGRPESGGGATTMAHSGYANRERGGLSRHYERMVREPVI
jgi:hypothetical protein